MRKIRLNLGSEVKISQLKFWNVFLVSFILPKNKWKNSTLLLHMEHTSSPNVFVCFLGEMKTPKRHFEIEWPLNSKQIVPNVIYGWPPFKVTCLIGHVTYVSFCYIIEMAMSLIIFILIKKGPHMRYQHLFPVPLAFKIQVPFSRKISKKWLF